MAVHVKRLSFKPVPVHSGSGWFLFILVLILIVGVAITQLAILHWTDGWVWNALHAGLFLVCCHSRVR